MLTDTVEAVAARPATPVPAFPGASQVEDFRNRLAKAERPFFILGGTRWDEASVEAFAGFAERWAVPVGCSFRRQMLFDHMHPCYAGDIGLGINPALSKAVKEADLIVLLGGRFRNPPPPAIR